MHAAAGCVDTPVEACVCAQDPYCCDSQWDGVCVDEVVSLGCGTCAAKCGDAVCDPSENCTSCLSDCGACNAPIPGCPVGQIKDCIGVCWDFAWLGDGLCDDGEPGEANFACPGHNWDGGACTPPACAADQIPDCVGVCSLASWLGDILCDEPFKCAYYNWDMGACAAPPPPACMLGQALDCNGGCSAAGLIQNGICTPAFACTASGHDGGDCGSGNCPTGSIPDCNGQCSNALYLGDGTCDNGTQFSENFDCAPFARDKGDCKTLL
jgi:hypothetical protein